jgi:hypothetical protein
MEAASSSETSLTNYKSTQRYFAEESNTYRISGYWIQGDKRFGHSVTQHTENFPIN